MTQFLRLRARNGGTSGKSKLGAKDTLSGTHKTTRNAYVCNVVGVYLTSITQRPAFPVTRWPSDAGSPLTAARPATDCRDLAVSVFPLSSPV